MPEIFRLEAERLAEVAIGLTEHQWSLPTACPPWSIRELLSHVRVVIAWLPGMLMGERPLRAKVSAADYYRADGRFDPETNARRISLAQAEATALGRGDALAKDFDAAWKQVYDLCRPEPPDRIVRTRHADAMLLSDFLLTRVVELAVHGLDLAAATGRDPISAAQSKQFDDLGVGWLSLG